MCGCTRPAIDLAQRVLDRVSSLRSRGNAPQSDLDAANAELLKAQAQLARAQATIEKKAVTAPFAGIVGIRKIDIGRYVAPGDALVTLQRLDQVYADFTLPEQAFSRISHGQKVEVRADAFPDEVFRGEVSGIEPVVDAASRMVKVRATIDNPGLKLRPGFFANVRLILPERPNVVTVPQTAITFSLYGDTIFVIREKQAEAGQQQPADQPAEKPAASGDGSQPPAGPQLAVEQVFVRVGKRQGNVAEIVEGREGGRPGRHLRPAQAAERLPGGDRQLGRPHPSAAGRILGPAGRGDAMNFTSIFIRRPVLASVVSLLILLLGLQGLATLPVRQFPKTEETVITITTAYPGASADLMQGFITTPIAQSVASTEGLDYVTSSSVQGVSTVSVHMKLNANPDAALTEVLTKVQQVRNDLPDESKDPVVVKGTGQEIAIQYIALDSDRMSPEEVTEYITRVVQPQLSTTEGVAEAEILGAKSFAMRVWVDPIRLAAHMVTAADVVTAIRANNFQSAPGRTEGELVTFAIRTDTTLRTAEAFGDLVVRSDGSNIVRLKDVARVELGSESYDAPVTFNGREAIFIAINPTPGGQPADHGGQCARGDGRHRAPDAGGHARRDRLRRHRVHRILDLGGRQDHPRGGGDRRGRDPAVPRLVPRRVIPVVTIPLSLIGVLFCLYVLGYSINTLTLLAMVLAIGLVVDDAIVVVENIHRHIEEGLTPRQAALKGAAEIAGPVVSMTITLAAVYVPIGFATGLTGALFREFAFTLAGAVIISGIVALTLSPMMTGKLLKPHGAGVGRFQRVVDRFFTGLQGWYHRRLHNSLNYRPVTVFLAVVLLAASAFLFWKTPSELAPKEDQGFVFMILEGPRYANLEYMNRFSDKLIKDLQAIPEHDAIFAINGAGSLASGFGGMTFKPWDERTRSGAEIEAQVQGIVGNIAGIEGFATSPPALPGSGGGPPVQFVIKALGLAPAGLRDGAADRQRGAAERHVPVRQRHPGLRPAGAVGRDRPQQGGGAGHQHGRHRHHAERHAGRQRHRPLRPRQPQLQGDPAGRAGKPAEPGGAEQVLHPHRRRRPDPAVLGGDAEDPGDGELLHPVQPAQQLDHPGGADPVIVTLGQALTFLQQTADRILPRGVSYDYEGDSRQYITEGNTVMIAFAFAVIVIFLVLAAQFESFRDPLIIMMSVPLSIFGALAVLNVGSILPAQSAPA